MALCVPRSTFVDYKKRKKEQERKEKENKEKYQRRGRSGPRTADSRAEGNARLPFLFSLSLSLSLGLNAPYRPESAVKVRNKWAGLIKSGANATQHNRPTLIPCLNSVARKLYFSAVRVM